MKILERSRIEKEIVSKFMLDAILAGCFLNLDYGCGPVLKTPTNSIDELTKEMFVDDEYLLVYKQGKLVGWVKLVYGNDGYDVISDYHTSLEKIMEGAEKIAESYWL